jgi:RNA polymerase sigma factor (sigma-70 family)
MEASASPSPRTRTQFRLPLGPATGDERLVARVRSGDQRAFERIVSRYERPLLSFCRHMLSRSHEAEEAVQQTFVSAYESMLRNPDRDISLRAWLFTIARNQSLSMLRARRDHADITVVEPATIGLAAAVEQREDLRHLLADLADLPDDQRAALLLFEIGALERDEIAGVLDCNPKKVKALVFQARNHLSNNRVARETPCEEIREQLSTLTGSALRRAPLRRHVRDCPGCSAFAAEVKRQRTALALVLPVAPGLAFKGSVMGAVGGSVGSLAATGAAGGGLATAGAVQAAVVALGVVAVGTGGAMAVQGTRSASHPVTPHVRTLSDTPAAAAATRTAFVAPTSRDGGAGLPSGDTGAGHGRSGTVPGQSGTAPGLSRQSSGRAGAPGLTGTAPGRSKTGSGKGRALKQSGATNPGAVRRANPTNSSGKGKSATGRGNASKRTSTTGNGRSLGNTTPSIRAATGAAGITPRPASRRHVTPLPTG